MNVMIFRLSSPFGKVKVLRFSTLWVVLGSKVDVVGTLGGLRDKIAHHFL